MVSHNVFQVVGDGNCVKKAVAIITDRLKESLHRDRGPFRGRMNSPEPRISQEDEYLSGVQQMPAYEESFGRSDHIRNNISMEPPGYEFDSNGGKDIEHPDILYDDIIFRILCPNDKAESLVATHDGIIEMLQGDVGVDFRLSDIIAGSDERVVIITSREVNQMCISIFHMFMLLCFTYLTKFLLFITQCTYNCQGSGVVADIYLLASYLSDKLTYK